MWRALHKAEGGLMQHLHLREGELASGKLYLIAFAKKFSQQLLIVLAEFLSRTGFAEKLFRGAMRSAEAEAILDINTNDLGNLFGKLQLMILSEMAGEFL